MCLLSQRSDKPHSYAIIKEDDLEYFNNSTIRLILNLYCIDRMEQYINKILSSRDPYDIAYAQGCITVLQEFLFMDFLRSHPVTTDIELINKCRDLLTSYIEEIKNKITGG